MREGEGNSELRIQNSEFGIQSESEAGRWIASPAARNDGENEIVGSSPTRTWNFFGGVAGRRNLICFFWKIERLVLF